MKQTFKKPSYYLLSQAMDGDEKAIEKILAFYDPYISKCCLRPLYDEYGNVYIVVENLAVWDDYDTDYTIFNVCGNDIRVYDDELAEALKQLSERNRETLLMYYFLEMNNEEIAKKQNISRSGVFQNRHNSLALMKKLLKENQ